MNNEIEKKKFHDKWAFFLYFINIASLIFLNYNNFFIKDNVINISDYEIKSFLYNLLNIACLEIIFFLLIKNISVFMIKFSMFIFLAVMICFLFINFNIISFIMFLIVGISTYFIYYQIIMNIDLIKAIINTASNIIIKYFSSIISMYFLFCLYTISIFYIVERYFSTINSKSDFFTFYGIFSILWTSFISYYLLSVIVSSIVYYEITKKNNKDIFKNSIINAFYSIGSVCCASLLISAITVSRLFINIKRNEKRKKNESILFIIFYYIIEIILLLLEDYIEFLNTFVIPYLALNNTSYLDSIKKSYNIISDRKNGILITNSSLGYLMALFNILTVLIFSFSSYFYLFNFGPENSLDIFLFNFIKNIIFFSLLNFNFLSILSSASVALVYTFYLKKNEFKKYDQKLYDFLSQKIYS